MHHKNLIIIFVAEEENACGECIAGAQSFSIFFLIICVPYLSVCIYFNPHSQTIILQDEAEWIDFHLIFWVVSFGSFP